jgi:hypothetical protein
MTAFKSTSEPSFLLKFEDRPDYFYIYLRSGKLDLETSKAFVRDGAAELKKTDHKKVLVELDVEERLSHAGIFWLASGFPDLGLEDYVFAVVDRRLEHQAVNEFADAAAYNNEVTRRTFTSLKEAEEWLESAQAHPLG